MDKTLLILGLFVVVNIYFNKKLGIILGLLLLVFMDDYPVEIKKDDTLFEIKCSEACENVNNKKIVCQTECLRNLKSILK